MQHRPVIMTPGIDDKCRGQVRLPLFPDGLAGRRKSGDPPLFKPSLKIRRDDTHTQNSALASPRSTVLNARPALAVHLNRTISSKAGLSVV